MADVLFSCPTCGDRSVPASSAVVELVGVWWQCRLVCPDCGTVGVVDAVSPLEVARLVEGGARRVMPRRPPAELADPKRASRVPLTSADVWGWRWRWAFMDRADEARVMAALELSVRHLGDGKGWPHPDGVRNLWEALEDEHRDDG